MKLYELPQRQSIPIYGFRDSEDKEDVTVIFDHIDGMYSYCWVKGARKEIVHLNASTELKAYKDGYTVELTVESEEI